MRPFRNIVNIVLLLILTGCFFASCDKSDVKIIPGKYNPNGSAPGSSNSKNGGATGTGSDSTAATGFFAPSDVAADAAGNVYVADYGNNRIQKVTPDGVVSILAGSGNVGSVNATGKLASFNGPSGVAVDAGGNVYVADFHNNLVRKITPAGVVSTLAGTVTNPADSTNTAPSVFFGPSAVAVDASGNVYVADSGDNQIKVVSPSGVVTSLAGNLNAGSNDGKGAAASFSNPTGVALDAANNVYVADFLNNMIRKISPAGVVTTIAGNGSIGNKDGLDTAARFYFPNSLTVDAAGNIYVADDINNLIREISPQGQVTTIAGSGIAGFANGQGTAASFNDPDGIAIDAAGNLYIADANNNQVRKINPAGLVSTLAGSVQGVSNHRANGPLYYHSGIGLKHKLQLRTVSR